MVNNKMKHVLMLVENATYPADERVRHEAGTLISAGYRVTVISPTGSRIKLFHEVIDGVNVYRFPHPPYAHGLLGYALEYGYSMVAIFLLSLFLLMKDGFDIVHVAHPPDTFVLIGAFYRLLGKKYVMDHHDLAPELYYYARFGKKGSESIHRFMLWLEKKSFDLADYVISTNESYRKIALERGGVPAQKISIVRNGPDLDELNSTEKAESLKQSDRQIIGYVGVMGTQDGVDNLMQAMKILIHDFKRTDVLCVILGTGSALNGLKKLAQELKIEQYVIFTGWIGDHHEVSRYLNSMDVCVAPEPSDPYNDRSTAAKIMEYMSAGKPVVSFDLPEHRFTAGAAGLYAHPGDVSDYAQKIMSLLDDPLRCEVLGSQGRARIMNHLAWSHQAKNLIEAYDRVTSQTSPVEGQASN